MWNKEGDTLRQMIHSYMTGIESILSIKMNGVDLIYLMTTYLVSNRDVPAAFNHIFPGYHFSDERRINIPSLGDSAILITRSDNLKCLACTILRFQPIPLYVLDAKDQIVPYVTPVITSNAAGYEATVIWPDESSEIFKYIRPQTKKKQKAVRKRFACEDMKVHLQENKHSYPCPVNALDFAADFLDVSSFIAMTRISPFYQKYLTPEYLAKKIRAGGLDTRLDISQWNKRSVKIYLVEYEKEQNTAARIDISTAIELSHVDRTKCLTYLTNLIKNNMLLNILVTRGDIVVMSDSYCSGIFTGECIIDCNTNIPSQFKGLSEFPLSYWRGAYPDGGIEEQYTICIDVVNKEEAVRNLQVTAWNQYMTHFHYHDTKYCIVSDIRGMFTRESVVTHIETCEKYYLVLVARTSFFGSVDAYIVEHNQGRVMRCSSYFRKGSSITFC